MSAIYALAGAGAALLIVAWVAPKYEARIWSAAWHAGRASLAADVDVLAARHPDLGALDALDLIDLNTALKERP